MYIVIAGAGDVGFHLAELLTIEDQSIVLVDLDEDLLQYASSHLDVMTVRGDITSIDVLNNAMVHKAQLFIAVTTSETVNLLSSILAKNMGAKKTIARIENKEFLENDQRENFKKLGIDNLFSPRSLAAQEIDRLLQLSSVTDIFEFAHGKISILGFTVDDSSEFVGKTFLELDKDNPDFQIRAIALLRDGETIIPHRQIMIRPRDHVYLVTNVKEFDRLNHYIGKKHQQVKRIMMIGGTELALQTAELLEDQYDISVIIKGEKRCKRFIEKLKNALVINGDVSNIPLLVEEGLKHMDAFIALTPNSETNILTSLTAEQYGVYKTIALVNNTAYTQISQNIGIDTLINKKIIAANNIFRYVRKGKIESITSMHGVDGEIIEFEIHKENQLTHKSISALPIPQDALIVGVIRNNVGLLPSKDFKLQLRDHVIIFVLPSAIKKIENIFK